MGIIRVHVAVYTCCCAWLLSSCCSVRGNVIDSSTVPMTLFNATNFIMRHQRYLLQDDGRIEMDDVQDSTGNEVNLNIDENIKDFVTSPLVLTTEVCNPGKCQAGKMEGVCISGESCFKHGGQTGNFCNGSSNLICCTFLLTCGDVSSQKVSYLQSPENLKIDSGSVACDYDVLVQKDTCAVRVDYEKVNLASKIGGVCDIDQIYILNSNDGPTTGQCGALTGYSTVVAVKPNQEKPLKIAMVLQSEPPEYWLIKVSQISCTEIKPFEEPPDCGLTSVGRSTQDDDADTTFGGGSGDASTPHLTPSTSSGPGRCDGDSTAGRWQRRRRVRSTARGPADDPRRRRTFGHPGPVATSDGRRTRPGGGGGAAAAAAVRGWPLLQHHAVAQGFDGGGGGGGGGVGGGVGGGGISGAGLGIAGGENRRIIGGTDAEIGEQTWQAAIALDGMFFCGGALIADQFVITAAHCVMTRDTPVNSLTVHLGDYDLTAENETQHQAHRVSRVLFHSHFHPFLLANDIALLRLDRPAAMGRTVRPVCLPTSDSGSYVGQKGTVLGWGITSFPSGDPSLTLQKLTVEVLSNFQCSRVIDDHVGLGMLCAAAPALQGTCFGDSGGPLTVERNTGRNVLIGLVSYGVTGCAIKPAFPDLYTRISEYTKWIDVSTLP